MTKPWRARPRGTLGITGICQPPSMWAGTLGLAEGRSKTRESRLYPFAASPRLVSMLRVRYDARAVESVSVFEVVQSGSSEPSSDESAA